MNKEDARQGQLTGAAGDPPIVSMNNYTQCRNPSQEPMQPEGNAWAGRSDELAAWALQHLVNRLDVWGSYLPVHQRTPGRIAVTRTGSLTREILAAHFVGSDRSDIVGIHTTSPTNTCRWALVDIDLHGDEPRHSRANLHAAIRMWELLSDVRMTSLLTSSNGRGGYHLLIPFASPIPAQIAFRLGRWIIKDWFYLGLPERPESFPKQEKLSTKTKFGNWVRLPGRHHTLDHWSSVYTNSGWVSGQNAVKRLLDISKNDAGAIPSDVYSFSLSETDENRPQTATQNKTCTSTGQRRVYSIDGRTPIEKILARLNSVVSCGDGWSARCPGHRDRRNSLSVAEGNDGRVLLYCHAGCSVEKIVDDMGLSMFDLFDRRHRRRSL